MTDIACHGREPLLTVQINCSTNRFSFDEHVHREERPTTNVVRSHFVIDRILCSAMSIGEFVKFGLVLRAS